MPKKRPVIAKKPAVSAFHVPQTVAWLMLFLSFTLAILSICTYKSMRLATNEMTGTIRDLQLQRAHQQSLLTAALAPKPPEKPTAKILTSVVKFREGELEKTQQNLIIPLLAFYDEQPEALSAVLIERKNTSSKDLNVRLFFADGKETSYLWPSTHSKNGIWTPSQK